MPAPPLLDVAKLDFSRPLYDRQKIASILPHRDAMAVVDGICYWSAKDLIIAGWKDVHNDEFWISGHFPGNPLLPGVMLVEASAQVALLGYKLALPEIAGRLVVFGGIDGARFRGAVRPGQRVVIVGKITEMGRRGARASTQALVDGRLVYEGQVFSVTT